MFVTKIRKNFIVYIVQNVEMWDPVEIIHESKCVAANGNWAPQRLQSADILTPAAKFCKGSSLVSLEVLRPRKMALRPHEAPFTL